MPEFLPPDGEAKFEASTTNGWASPTDVFVGLAVLAIVLTVCLLVLRWAGVV